MFLRKVFIAAILLLLGVAVSFAQTKATDVVMVLPFENTSNKPEFNWVGESFAMSISELLRVPTLDVVSNSERKVLQQKLRIPLTSLPSLATSLKLARAGSATLLITGYYTIVPAEGDMAATINVTTKIVRVNEGRFLTEDLPDGRRVTRDITLNDALGNLQTMQGITAYQILYQRDKALPFSQNTLIEAASKVPSRAFEAYIKGLLTSSPELRENFFRNAMRLYTETQPDGTFADAALELGHLYLGQRKYNESVDAFERVVNAHTQCREKARGDNRIAQCNDESYAEASFYIGVIRWEQGNYEQALAVLQPLADDLKLTSVYNMLGAISVQASRAEKKNPARAAALLTQGEELLKKALESAPDDRTVRFNLAVTQFLNGNFVDSAANLKQVVDGNKNDGDAYYVLAKAQNELKQDGSQSDANARRLLTMGNRYANFEKEWLKSKTIGELNLRVEQPQRKDFVSVVLSKRAAEPVRTTSNETDNLLIKARTAFKNGDDDEAMATIRRILASEPMSAESYLILGKIHLRRADREQATSAFKTAIFWDNRLIDAHVALGKIFLERGDCQQAKTYAASALEIDKENPEAQGFQRQAERCSK
ncbi:MAG: tetratricopeptide repeat protein [Pyrinomonadaceae bacterium]